MEDNLFDKTLEELDGHETGEPNFGSYVVINCHRLRRVPLREFTVEDLRLMIGQSQSLDCLLPIALQHLRQNPLAEGNFFPGDLLAAVLRHKGTFWQENPTWYADIKAILDTPMVVPREIEMEVQRFQRIKL